MLLLTISNVKLIINCNIIKNNCSLNDIINIKFINEYQTTFSLLKTILAFKIINQEIFLFIVIL